MNKPKTPKGLSIIIVFGQFAKPKIQIFNKSTIFRLCLGWVALSIVKYDIESLIGLFIFRFKKDRELLEKLQKNLK